MRQLACLFFLLAIFSTTCWAQVQPPVFTAGIRFRGAVKSITLLSTRIDSGEKERVYRAEFDTKGNIVSQIIGDGGKVFRYEWAYDSTEKPISMTWYIDNKVESKETFTYVSIGTKVESVANNPDKPKSITNFDAQGKRLNTITPSGETKYSYDAKGRLTQITIFSNVPNDELKELTYRYIYDEADNLIEEDTLSNGNIENIVHNVDELDSQVN